MRLILIFRCSSGASRFFQLDMGFAQKKEHFQFQTLIMQISCRNLIYIYFSVNENSIQVTALSCLFCNCWKTRVVIHYSKHQEHGRRIPCNNSDCMAWCKYCTKLIYTVVPFRLGKSVMFTSSLWITRITRYWYWYWQLLAELNFLLGCLSDCM